MRRNPLHALRRRSARAARRLLHRTGQKASPFGVVSVASDLTQSKWSARTFQNYAREAYNRNVIAYRSIFLRASGLGMIPWYVTRGKDRDIIDDPNDPAIRVLERPNPSQGGAAFFEALDSYYLIMGNSYVLRVNVNPKRAAELKPNKRQAGRLYVLRADKVRPHYDQKTGQLEKYVYEISNTRKVEYPVHPVTEQSDVLHLMTFNPLDETLGMSPAEPCAFGVDQHNASSEWNYHLLKNSAKPAGVIEHDPGETGGELTDEQYERIKKMLYEKHEGSRHAGKIMLLDGFLKWKQAGLSPMDMDFNNTKNSAARDICTAYGVPPMLVGITGDATYANYREARLALWEDTILPHARYVRDELNNWLMPGYGDNYRLEIDEDQIPAIAEKRLATWEKIESTSFISIDEKREAASYDEWMGEDADVLMMNAALLPIPQGGDEDEDEPATEVTDEVEDELQIDPEKAARIGYGR
jgi:HK97 family phage portal protein